MKSPAKKVETSIDLSLINSELRYRRLFETAQEALLKSQALLLDYPPEII
jgi:hypothetical protein